MLIPYSSKFSRSKTSEQLFVIHCCSNRNIFVDKIFVIYLHLTKITKFIDLENLVINYETLDH